MRAGWMAAAMLVACGGGEGGALDAKRCADSVLPVAWSRDLERGDTAVAFDADGSLVLSVAGAAGEGEATCAQLVRFTADGTELWRHDYDPSPLPDDSYRPCPFAWKALALDADGAIVTLGYIDRYPTAGDDVIVRKHDRDGNALWTYFNRGGLAGLMAEDIDVGPDGEIVAVGEVSGAPWAVGLAADGSLRWSWSGTGQRSTDVEVDADGNAFVGIATGEEATPYRIARLDPAGSETPVSELTRTVSLAMTPDGSLVFVLPSTVPRLRKIDASGTIVWDQVLRLSPVDEDCHQVVGAVGASDIEIGPDGSIHAALPGTVDHVEDPEFPETEYMIVLARFSSDGELLSRHTSEMYGLEDLAVAPDGDIALSTEAQLIVVPPLDGG